MIRTHASVLFLSLAFFASSSARAAEPEPGEKKASSTTQTTGVSLPMNAKSAEVGAEPASPEDDTRSLRGLEIVLRPSFGGAGSGSPVRFTPSPTVQGDPGPIARGDSSPYGSGFVGDAQLGYRFHPLVSAGVRAGLRNASAGAVSGAQNLARSSWNAGLYARAYPLALTSSVRKHLDPWLGVGVAYMRDLQTFQTDLPTTKGGTVKADMSYDHHAVAVPLGVGVDYRVLPMLSLGPSFEYTLANAVAGCIKASALGSTNTYCSNEDPGKAFVKADGYGVWTAGLDVRATF